jgi:oxaloacetate decarboxylase gamma subunit
MTIVEMLGQSGVLTLLGLGVVFSFLVIMVVCISLAGKLIHAMGTDQVVAGPAAAPPPRSGSNAANGEALTAAISAAVNEYQKKNS